MILTRAQMLEAEKAAFAKGARAEDLMEAAGMRLADMVRQFHPDPGTCHVFAGKGNNGGDVLVSARHLAAAGWTIRLVLPEAPLAPLAEVQRMALETTLGNAKPWPPSTALVVLDGLLGIGARGNPREPIANAIHAIRRLRDQEGAWVLAADLPSGLDPDSGKPSDVCVQADATLTIGFAKSGLVADTAPSAVGRLAVFPLEGVTAPVEADQAGLVTPDALRGLLPPRPFDMHKGLCGRIAILAGSSGLTGAARLSSAAAVHAGGGLVTLCVPRDVYPILATSAIPEVMVRPINTLDEILRDRWDVIALGPGLGDAHRPEILEILRRAPCPCVVDADALNAVSATGTAMLANCPAPRLLTPHPGEMERLFPRGKRSRRQWLEDFVQEFPVTLLLKGSRTVIGEKGCPPVFNTTGDPGMASGGMGDVLTGVCAALIGQGKPLREAAMLGAWVCGRAAELALLHGSSRESLSASRIIDHLGRAFNDLRADVL